MVGNKILRPSKVVVVKNKSMIKKRRVNEKIVGIDLGTTNSEVAVMEAGKPIVIKSSEGNTYFLQLLLLQKMAKTSR